MVTASRALIGAGAAALAVSLAACSSSSSGGSSTEPTNSTTPTSAVSSPSTTDYTSLLLTASDVPLPGVKAGTAAAPPQEPHEGAHQSARPGDAEEHLAPVPRQPRGAEQVAHGPVSLAAVVQVAACTPNFLITEYVHSRETIAHRYVKEPLRVVDGHVAVPDRPGIGVELDEDALKEYPAGVREVWSPSKIVVGL